MLNKTYLSHSEEETIKLGNQFAKFLKNGDVVAFYGDLGSGKTEFIKGICDFFAVKEIVTSPTFTIMNHYNGIKDNSEVVLYHIDLYRINKKEDLLEIGFRDCMFSDKSIKLVEWAEKGESMIPTTHFNVEITPSLDDENLRTVNVYQTLEVETELV